MSEEEIKAELEQALHKDDPPEVAVLEEQHDHPTDALGNPAAPEDYRGGDEPGEN